MTEGQLEEAMERFGRAVEHTADRFDRSVNRAWRYRSVNLAGRVLSLLMGIGLAAGAMSLYERGKHAAAKACLVGGGLVIAMEVIQIVLFRKK